MKATRKLALAGLVILCPYTASADCLSAYSGYLSGGIFAQQALSSYPECFGGGPTTAQVLFSATAGQQMAAISSSLARRRIATGAPSLAAANMHRGMAAGDEVSPLNLWLSGSSDNTEQRYNNTSGDITRNDFDVQNYIFGGDFDLAPDLLLGLSLAFDRGDISGITSALGAEKNELDSDGFMLAPYLSWQLNDEWAVDASLGIGQGELEASGSSRQESDRWYAGANLGYQSWLDSWQFSGKLGFLYAEEAYDDLRLRGETAQDLNASKLENSDATNELARLELGGQVGYWWQGWMPYAGLRYLDDVHRSTTQNFAPSDPIGREAWIWSLGLNYFSLTQDISAGLAYEQEEGRSRQNLDSWTANLNLRF